MALIPNPFYFVFFKDGVFANDVEFLIYTLANHQSVEWVTVVDG